jgi:hypothetical protein
MKLSPKSSEGWSSFIFFPFRVYIFAAFVTEYLMQASWPRHGGSPPIWVLYISFGYVISFLLFILGGVTEVAARKPQVAVAHFLFAVLAFIFGTYSLRFLASA